MKKLLSALVVSILLVSCNSEQSLQEYLVERDNSSDFISASIPTNLIFQNMDSLSSEEKESLQKIEKINLLALTKKKGSAILEEEREALRSILAQTEFESLINFNGGDREAKFVYSGTEDKIDELVFFGFDAERGLLLLRMRGNDVNANDIYQITQSAKQFDMNGLPGGLEDLVGGFN